MAKRKSEIELLIKNIIEFRDARDWKQFHNPKDLSLSLVLEAAELMEHFQWKDPKAVQKHIQNHKKDISDELADVMYWVLLMSYELKINILEALKNKIKDNEKKYPLEKSKGNALKYTEL